jgi:hypothetical protein
VAHALTKETFGTRGFMRGATGSTTLFYPSLLISTAAIATYAIGRRQ